MPLTPPSPPNTENTLRVEGDVQIGQFSRIARLNPSLGISAPVVHNVEFPTDFPGGVLDASAFNTRDIILVSVPDDSVVTWRGISAKTAGTYFMVVTQLSPDGDGKIEVTHNDGTVGDVSARFSTPYDKPYTIAEDAGTIVISDGGGWKLMSQYGVQVQDEGVAVGTVRPILNFQDTTSIIPTAVESAADDRINVSFELAAVSGAVSIATGTNISQFAGIRDNGSLETARGFINFVNGTNTAFVLTQDAGSDEIEVALNVDNFPLSGLADQADDTFLANIAGSSAPPTAVTLTSIAGDGLTYDAANHHFDVVGSTSITITSDQVQRAALSGAISAALNTNTTQFAGIRDNGTLETARGFINFVNGTNTTVTLTQDAGNDEIEVAVSVDDLPITALGDIAQSRILGRAEGAGTGPVTELTPTQVVAVIDSESVSWTGNHSFTSATFTVDTTGDINFDTDDDFTIGSLGSVELAAGEDAVGTLANGVVSIRGTADVLLRGGAVGIYTGALAATVTDVGGADIILNSTGGIGIICDPFAVSATSGITNGFVTVQALHDISLFTTSGGIGISTDNSLVSGIDGAVGNGFVHLRATDSFRVDTGGTTQRLVIEADGAWDVGGSTGTAGQVLKSNGAGSPPSWQADTDTTYSAGDGIDLTGTVFSADVSDFAGTGLEDDGANNLRIAAAAAGAGLTGGAGSALAVGAGTHITVNANDVALSTTSAGRVYGARIDAGANEIVELTGLEQGENLQIGTVIVDAVSSGDLNPYTGFPSPNNCLVFQNTTVNLRSMTARANTWVWIRHTGTGSTTIQDEDSGAVASEAFSTGCGAIILRNDQQALFLHTSGQWRMYACTVVVPTEAEKQLSSLTGNMGTINIDDVPCGGTVRAAAGSASSAYSIEGWAKTTHVEGFWFHFSVETGATNHCTLFHNDATATTTNRMWLPVELDISQVPNLDGIFYYRDNRWRWCGTNPKQLAVGPNDYIRVNGPAAATIDIATNTGDINVAAGGNLNGSGDNVTLDATASNGIVSVTSQAGAGGGSLQLTEQAASPNVNAGRGMYWVQNQVPSAPMFTDDTNIDREIATIGAPLARGTAASFGVPFIISFERTSGTGGAGDTVLFNANAPFAFRMLAFGVEVQTGVAASTVEFRSATAGGGSVYSPLLSTAVSGAHSVGASWGSTADPVVAAGGTLVLRWSDIDARAYVWALCVRT